MTDGIIQKVFDRKTKRMGDYMTAFMIEELKHELVIELSITNHCRTPIENNHEANTSTEHYQNHGSVDSSVVEKCC